MVPEWTFLPFNCLILVVALLFSNPVHFIQWYMLEVNPRSGLALGPNSNLLTGLELKAEIECVILPTMITLRSLQNVLH